MDKFLVFSSSVLLLCASLVSCQLVVNVKNKGGDVLVESIQANTTEDTVTLEYQNTDGTLITQFIDFKSEVQIFRAYVAGEEERGQNQLQVLCFISRFSKNDFISSDAMSKLRQKNPTAIRSPEEEKGPDLMVYDLQVDLSKSHMISQHVFNMCQEAKETTFFKEGDLTTISRSLSKDYNTLMSGMKKTYPSKYARCHDTNDLSKPCLCHYQMCVGWYPCGLKYCRGKDSAGKVVSYRCGIKTCRRCLVFEHVARQRLWCLWDDS
ncbi:out at first protein-like [Haliotis rufescens]|uniref:out at first protein-like n=1 Tax=Haliotis rufescens TaxID=6454 RepID=UPI00201EE107|nr:out at first protein-like [Haliotis rufescens]